MVALLRNLRNRNLRQAQVLGQEGECEGGFADFLGERGAGAVAGIGLGDEQDGLIGGGGGLQGGAEFARLPGGHAQVAFTFCCGE